MALRRLSFIALLVVLAPAIAAGWPDFDGKPDAAKKPEASAPAVGPASPADQRLWVVVRAASRSERSKAASLGLDIQEASASTVAGVATPEGLARLQAAGFRVERHAPLSRALPKVFPPKDDAFHDYAEVQAALAAIAAAHPGVASLVEVGQSVRGRKLTAIRFNPSARGSAPSPKPGALFVGNHHAREHLSTEVPLLAAIWLADNLKKPEVAKLLESRDVYFLPLLNPDGAEHDVATGDYRWQRKNLRANPDGSTGVDLNRNYAAHWGEAGTSTHPSDDTYGGPGPFSEPETQALKAFVEARPNLKTMASYHSYGELVLYPWSYTEEPLSDGPALAAFKAMGQKLAGFTGYTAEQSSELYPSSGDTCDWAWDSRRVFCFTFELTPKGYGGGGFYPGAGAIQPTVSKNLPAILYLIEMAADPLRAGRANPS